jgi:F0F1-type ATP synthase assembly protein I
MQFIVKLAISLCIIVVATQVGRRFPSLGGLIATMPLTGMIVLVWLYSDHPGDVGMMKGYTKGALWGIAPSILFFIVAYICFHRHMPITMVLLMSFGAWLVGAFFHQLLLR